MGAWTQVYKLGDGKRSGTDNVSLAISAIKKELGFLHYSFGNTGGHFGPSLDVAIKDFQFSRNLLDDGIIGPKTARALFDGRITLIEEAYNIPDRLLCGMVAHESSFDPGAFGSVDPDDKGLVQINVRIHTTISIAQAFDPYFSLNYAGKFLHDLHHDRYAPDCKTIAWDCAVIAWNSPRNANSYCQTGTPNDAAKNYIDNVREGCI